MGNDTPLAVLSQRKPLLYSYFKQLFAQVTNPPIDSIREAVVMSVKASVGSERNLLDETPEHARQLVIDNPILRDSELDQLRHVRSDVFKAHTVDTTWAGRGRRGRARDGARPDLPQRRHRARRRHEHPHPVRPRRGADARAGAVAARHRRRAQPSRPRGHAPADGHRRRVRRAAQRAQHRDADRLRRRRSQPVPDARDARRARRAGLAAGGDERREGPGTRGQGNRQGPAQDDVQDGHLDHPVVLRRADLRGGRALVRARRPALHLHAVADRRHRAARARRGLARPPRARVPGLGRTSCCP